MICQHTTIHAPRYGSTGICVNCRVVVIYNGAQWRWINELDDRKVRKMRTAYLVDTITNHETEKETSNP